MCQALNIFFFELTFIFGYLYLNRANCCQAQCWHLEVTFLEYGSCKVLMYWGTFNPIKNLRHLVLSMFFCDVLMWEMC
jgi:hypothetical protein